MRSRILPPTLSRPISLPLDLLLRQKPTKVNLDKPLRLTNEVLLKRLRPVIDTHICAELLDPAAFLIRASNPNNLPHQHQTVVPKPEERRKLTLLHPNTLFAICTTIVPTAPAAPLTTTVSPSRAFTTSTSP